MSIEVPGCVYVRVCNSSMCDGQVSPFLDRRRWQVAAAGHVRGQMSGTNACTHTHTQTHTHCDGTLLAMSR